MKALKLIRFASTPWGTFGTLELPSLESFVTLEPRWRNNEPNVSCIGLGDYRVKQEPSPIVARITLSRYKCAWYLQKVPGRSRILIHPGNFENDTQGCILIGMRIETINGRPGIAASQKAFGLFSAAMEKMPSELLSVRWASMMALPDRMASNV